LTFIKQKTQKPFEPPFTSKGFYSINLVIAFEIKKPYNFV